jgi:hypothetical protein
MGKLHVGVLAQMHSAALRQGTQAFRPCEVPNMGLLVEIGDHLPGAVAVGLEFVTKTFAK